jgi:hypothetical protein
MKRAFVTLFVLLGGIAIACAERLEDLAPFPCANDGTCPPSYSCIKDVGCKRGSTLDRACEPRGAGCAEGTCVGGICARHCGPSDRVCDPGRICSYPPPGESAPLAHCLLDCTTTDTCPEGLECFPLYDDKKACVTTASKRSIDRACATPADCLRAGVTFLPISCARGTCALFCSAVPAVKCADPTRTCFIGDPVLNSGCLTDCTTSGTCLEGLSCKDPPTPGPRTCSAAIGDGGGGGGGGGRP